MRSRTPDSTRPARLRTGPGGMRRDRGIGPYRAARPARVSPLRFPERGLHSRLNATRVGSAVNGTVPPLPRTSREPLAAIAACIVPPEIPGANGTTSSYAGSWGTAIPDRMAPGWTGSPVGPARMSPPRASALRNLGHPNLATHVELRNSVRQKARAASRWNARRVGLRGSGPSYLRVAGARGGLPRQPDALGSVGRAGAGRGRPIRRSPASPPRRRSSRDMRGPAARFGGRTRG